MAEVNVEILVWEEEIMIKFYTFYNDEYFVDMDSNNFPTITKNIFNAVRWVSLENAKDCLAHIQKEYAEFYDFYVVEAELNITIKDI